MPKAFDQKPGRMPGFSVSRTTYLRAVFFAGLRFGADRLNDFSGRAGGWSPIKDFTGQTT
jgi:hypothetical protein